MPDFKTYYDNFALDNPTVSITVIMWAICIGLAVGSVFFTFTKHAAASIIKKLARGEYNTKEKTASLKELGLKPTLLLKKALRDGQPLAKYVIIENPDECRIERKNKFFNGIYKHFRKEGFNYIQFIPCLRPMGDDTQSELYMTAEQYSDFLIRIFNLYVKDFVRGNYISIRQFDNWVRMYLGQRPEQCGLLGHCTHQFVCEGNGNIYPCDFYCTDEWLLGNINEDSLEAMAKGEKATAFIKESIPMPVKCKDCRFLKICRGGGCKRNRESADYCQSYMKFFSSCLPLFRAFTDKLK